MRILKIKFFYFIFHFTYIIGLQQKNKKKEIISIKEISSILDDKRFIGEVEFLNNSNIYFYKELKKLNCQIDFCQDNENLEIFFSIFKEQFYYDNYYQLYIKIPKEMKINFKTESGNYLTNFTIFGKNEKNQK
jgi:hypothetical protein